MEPIDDVIAKIDALAEEMLDRKPSDNNKEASSVWASEYLKRFNLLLQDPQLTKEERESLEKQFKKNLAQLAGMAMGPWLPVGKLRKVLSLLFLFLGIYLLLKGYLLALLLVVFSMAFSPRIVGEVTYLLGTVVRSFSEGYKSDK